MNAQLLNMRRTLRSEGLAIHPIKMRAPYLRGYGFEPEVVIDVGVGSGTPWLYRSFPDAQFVLIDPLKECADAVRSKGHLESFHFHNVALGADEDVATLNMPYSEKGREADMASLLRRTDKLATKFVKTESIEVSVKPLDSVAFAYPGRVGLKLDTEGSELDILLGAQETLKRCEFVILEMSVSPRFDGVGAPSGAVAIMAEAGLEMRDVMAVGAGLGKKARPRYLDLLFTRWAA